MRLLDALQDFALLSVLLLIGYFLRMKIRVLQKYFIPTSLIAGMLGMLLGPQWLGRVSPIYIPFTESISQWAGVLVIFVCATMFLGIELGRVGRDGMATTFLAGVIHQSQLMVGLGIAALFGLFGSGLLYQFGYMGVWGYYAGHGNAATVGNIIQDAGYWNDAVGVGVTFATLGILSGIIIGMVVINWGARRGLTKVQMSFEKMPESDRTGFISPDNRRSIGQGVSNPSSLDPLALQLALVGLIVVIGILIRNTLIRVHPIMTRFPLVGAVLVSSMIAGFLINRSSAKRFVDQASIRRLTGTALEFMIAAAIATTSLEIFTTYALPLMVISAALVVINLVLSFGLGKRWFSSNWFETAVGLFGQCSGVLATGLLLVKVVDPEGETTAAQCISTSSTLGYSWQIPYMVIGSLAIFAAPVATTIVSAIFLLVCLIGGEILYGPKRKRKAI